MKKPVALIAVALAASCTLTFTACGGSTKNNAALSSNWYANTAFKYIQPTITEGNENFTATEGAEKITYKVSYQAPEIGNGTYEVNYPGNNTYTTEFYAKTFVVSALTDGDYRSGYPSKAGFTAYYYKTVLDIQTITYKLKASGEEKSFEGDKVVTECYFMPVGDYLRPLYSKQTVKSTSPANLQANALENGNAYKLIESEYENFYSYDGKSAKSVKKDILTGETTVTVNNNLGDCKNSLFDFTSLNIVARATNLTTSLSQVLSLYSPESGVQNYTLTGSDTPLSTDESTAATLKTDFENKLYEKGLFKRVNDNEGNPVGLKTIAVSVLYGGEKSGVSQTYWFAAIDNAANNTGRTTLLKMSVPLTYNLGTLNYTLQSFESTLWNK
ncbi:MAG: hypothetical protein HDP34_03405 [Clostridia bacterium]|nr:hypothetical protein [Clostridia bacterium]